MNSSDESEDEVKLAKAISKDFVSDRDLVQRCFEDQISEISLLRSMYSSPDELLFRTEHGSNADLTAIDGCCAQKNCENLLYLREFWSEFTVKLRHISNDAEIELTFRIPPNYPRAAQLSVYVRSPRLDNVQSNSLNASVRRYLNDLPVGEPRVTDVIAWIQEHFDEFSTENASLSSPINANLPVAPPRFERLWLYSHHIYSTTKRKNILAASSENRLTGFCMPGKPGVICVEGLEEDCQQFWETIRKWTWKKLVIKHTETTDLEDRKEVDGKRKFAQFKEVAFDARHGGGREFHMDMGVFKEFLTERGCGDVFSILFGLD